MTIKSKLKSFFFLDDDYDDEMPAETREPVKQKDKPVRSQNVVSLQSVQKTANVQKSSKVILVEPRSYSEATEIADQIKNRRAVVVNLQRIDAEQGRQIIDFLSGAVYIIQGDIQKIGSGIFLCTPENMEVSGNISSLLLNHDNSNTRW